VPRFLILLAIVGGGCAEQATGPDPCDPHDPASAHDPACTSHWPTCTSRRLAPITVPVGLQPTGLVGAEAIDGPFTTSLLVADTGSSSVHVIRPTSETTFATTELATGAEPTAVAAVDVDRDGKTDIVVANGKDDTVSIFHNLGWGSDVTYAGVATFAPAVTLAVGHRPSALATIYRQAGSNLAVANRDDNTLTILVNDGHGAFTVGSTVSVGARPVALAADYYDNDLHTDVVVANEADDTIGVLLNSGDDATFGAMKPHATGMAPSAITSSWSNGNDPVADVWVANANSNDVSFFAHQGGGEYAPAVITNALGSPRGIVHTDFSQTLVADFDHGVVRTLETGDEVAMGAHPTSLFVESDEYAVTNVDAGTVTISVVVCTH
jgi:hypothetical protein